MRLGPDATLDEILEKMESIHGTVEREESLITNFYSALQKGDENTTAWECRIEDLLSKAVSIGKIHHDDVDEMLKYKFWTGLRQDLKDITGYLYDKCTTFDKLRKEIRLVELEHPVNKKSAPSMNVAASGEFTSKSDDISDLKAMIQKLSTKVENLETQKKVGSEQESQIREQGYTCFNRRRPTVRNRSTRLYRNDKNHLPMVGVKPHNMKNQYAAGVDNEDIYPTVVG